MYGLSYYLKPGDVSDPMYTCISDILGFVRDISRTPRWYLGVSQW